jgi:hypothetical protein
MTIQADNNNYARLLKEQGSFVIRVGDVDWYDYGRFMIPAYLPHCTPAVSEETAQAVLKESGRPFVRWDSRFGKVEASEWWYVLKKGPWAIENVKDKKKRWMIRQGQKFFSVRPLTFDEVISKCPQVAELATARYKGEANIETRQILERRIEAANKVPSVLEYIGCFYGDALVSFSENYIQNNAVWLATIRHDPAYLGRYSSYGFLDGILDYYLNEKKLLFVLDGCRNIYHRTDFQEHLVKVFGFTKEYALLNVMYRPKFAIGVKTAYALRGVIWNLSRIWTNSTLDKVSGILRQEDIRRACQLNSVNNAASSNSAATK